MDQVQVNDVQVNNVDKNCKGQKANGPQIGVLKCMMYLLPPEEAKTYVSCMLVSLLPDEASRGLTLERERALSAHRSQAY